MKKEGFVPISSSGTTTNMRQVFTNINPFLLAIPAVCDIIASTLMNIALTMVPASVYQMLRGMIIIITAGMSIIFLKRKLYRHHWWSIIIIFLGVFLVGLAALIFSKKDSTPTKVLGIILLIVSQFFAGAMLIIEEKLLSNY